MARVVPLLLRGAGTANFGPIQVNPTAMETKLTVDVEQMTEPDQAFELEAEVSFDGGATWRFGGAVHREGGHLLSGRSIVNTAGMTLIWPANGPMRRIRGTLTIGEVILVNGRPRCNPSVGQPVVLALDVD